MTQVRSARGASQTAVVVRLVAFLVAASSVLAIPAAIVAAGAGRVPAHLALYTVGGAAGLIVLAALAVRGFDPLRG